MRRFRGEVLWVASCPAGAARTVELGAETIDAAASSADARTLVVARAEHLVDGTEHHHEGKRRVHLRVVDLERGGVRELAALETTLNDWYPFNDVELDLAITLRTVHVRIGQTLAAVDLDSGGVTTLRRGLPEIGRFVFDHDPRGRSILWWRRLSLLALYEGASAPRRECPDARQLLSATGRERVPARRAGGFPFGDRRAPLLILA